MRDSAEDKQSRIAWQTVNKKSRRRSSAKANCQEERMHLGKQHFESLFGKP